MPNHRLLTIAVAFALVGLSACGAGNESTTAATTTPITAVENDEDHDELEADEDHDSDEDHDDHDDSSGLGAHEHGTAEMTVAWVGGDVAIDLISPVFNVFGFEYEPETDDDIALAADRTSELSAPGTLTLDDEAGCTLTEPVTTQVEREGSHSEITVSWLFTCESPNEISLLDASELFAAFPNFEDIDAQWISDTNQSSAELSPQAPTLSLES